MNIGKLGVWYFFDALSARAAADAAKRIEQLGFSTLWLPEALGRDPFSHAAWLLANTTKLNVATGIVNIYHREPGVTLAAQKTVAEQSDDRFLLGLGVSHKPLVEGMRGLNYGPPAATMRSYLEKVDQSAYTGAGRNMKTQRVIAALGPQMLRISRDQCDGAHPYFSNPTHTKMARDILGPDKHLCVEQKIILESDPVKARTLARGVAQMYLGLPNYRNNWLRMGLSEADLTNGGSDRFVDETFAWGDLGAIRTRIQQHFDAGASHICVQPVNPNGAFGDLHWDVLEKLAPG